MPSPLTNPLGAYKAWVRKHPGLVSNLDWLLYLAIWSPGRLSGGNDALPAPSTSTSRGSSSSSGAPRGSGTHGAQAGGGQCRPATPPQSGAADGASSSEWQYESYHALVGLLSVWHNHILEEGGGAQALRGPYGIWLDLLEQVETLVELRAMHLERVAHMDRYGPLIVLESTKALLKLLMWSRYWGHLYLRNPGPEDFEVIESKQGLQDLVAALSRLRRRYTTLADCTASASSELYSSAGQLLGSCSDQLLGRSFTQRLLRGGLFLNPFSLFSSSSSSVVSRSRKPTVTVALNSLTSSWHPASELYGLVRSAPRTAAQLVGGLWYATAAAVLLLGGSTAAAASSATEAAVTAASDRLGGRLGATDRAEAEVEEAVSKLPHHPPTTTSATPGCFPAPPQPPSASPGHSFWLQQGNGAASASTAKDEDPSSSAASQRQHLGSNLVWLGEVLYIARPVVYVVLLHKHGRTSWRPWSISLAVDLLSMYFHQRGKWHMTQALQPAVPPPAVPPPLAVQPQPVSTAASASAAAAEHIRQQEQQGGGHMYCLLPGIPYRPTLQRQQSQGQQGQQQGQQGQQNTMQRQGSSTEAKKPTSLLSLALARSLSSPDWSPGEKRELAERRRKLLLYLLRSPALDCLLRSPLNVLVRSSSSVPLLGSLLEYCQGLLDTFTQYYTYTAGSS